MTSYAILLFIFIFILGTIMGSFVGAMTWRMKRKKDWVMGRSECEHCHHQLSALDLIPIVSYVSLGGRCRYCRKPIGATAILLEIGAGLAFLTSALLWPSLVNQSWTAPTTIMSMGGTMTYLSLGLWLACVVIFVALFVYDMRWHLLPNKLVFPLIGLALICSGCLYVGVYHFSVGEWVINLVLGLMPITGIYGLMYLMSGGRWIGLGDVKLGVAIGFLVPWWGGLIILFVANLLGSLASIPGLAKKKLKVNSEIAFGPYLIAATYLVFLLGWVLKPILLVV